MLISSSVILVIVEYIIGNRRRRIITISRVGVGIVVAIVVVNGVEGGRVLLILVVVVYWKIGLLLLLQLLGMMNGRRGRSIGNNWMIFVYRMARWIIILRWRTRIAARGIVRILSLPSSSFSFCIRAIRAQSSLQTSSTGSSRIAANVGSLAIHTGFGYPYSLLLCLGLMGMMRGVVAISGVLVWDVFFGVFGRTTIPAITFIVGTTSSAITAASSRRRVVHLPCFLPVPANPLQKSMAYLAN